MALGLDLFVSFLGCFQVKLRLTSDLHKLLLDVETLSGDVVNVALQFQIRFLQSCYLNVGL